VSDLCEELKKRTGSHNISEHPMAAVAVYVAVDVVEDVGVNTSSAISDQQMAAVAADVAVHVSVDTPIATGGAISVLTSAAASQSVAVGAAVDVAADVGVVVGVVVAADVGVVVAADVAAHVAADAPSATAAGASGLTSETASQNAMAAHAPSATAVQYVTIDGGGGGVRDSGEQTVNFIRCIGCLKLQVFFSKRATNYRALLRKMICKNKASCRRVFANLLCSYKVLVYMHEGFCVFIHMCKNGDGGGYD